MAYGTTFVTAEDLRHELTRQDYDEPTYVLRDAQIMGKLDLRNRTVNVAVDIQNCEFMGDVDLRQCEFLRAVDVSGCIFFGDLRSGDVPDTHTIYRKDLTCNRTLFKGGVGFYGSRIEGSARFWRSVFQNRERPVDFSLCQIEKTLEFEETVFRGPVNFNGLRCGGTSVFYKAAFEGQQRTDFGFANFGGNLECDETIFEGPANFGRLTVAANGFFRDAKFRSEEKVNFGGARFGANLEFEHATFSGPANFNALQCGGSALFRGTEFENSEGVNFDHASFAYGVDYSSSDLRQTIFDGPASLKYLKTAFVGSRGTVWRGPASFNSLECDNSGFFENASFEGAETDFGHASFKMNLVCNDAVFRGRAHFDSLQCGLSGFFHDVTFEGSVDFNHASFGKNLGCDGATFWHSVSLRSIKCVESAFFRDVRFGQGADFGYGSFGNLECKGDRTIFAGRANFNRVRCEGSARFENARFLGANDKTDFVLSHFGINLSLNGARFVAPVDFWNAHVGRALVLTSARFDREVALGGTTMGQLEVKGEVLPFEAERVSLRGCSFSMFVGEESMAERLADSQDPTAFSRDPYIQLEKHYDSIGEDGQATRMYVRGHLARRRNASDEAGIVQWPSKTANLLDWLWKSFTCYGVSVWRLLLLSVCFIAIGTLLFYFPKDALVRTGAAMPVATEDVTSGVRSGKESRVDGRPWEESLLYRAEYSLDLFLPIVNLRIDEKWVPNRWWLQAYAVLHSLVGWLVIPLLVAALAGVMRR